MESTKFTTKYINRTYFTWLPLPPLPPRYVPPLILHSVLACPASYVAGLKLRFATVLTIENLENPPSCGPACSFLLQQNSIHAETSTEGWVRGNEAIMIQCCSTYDQLTEIMPMTLLLPNWLPPNLIVSLASSGYKNDQVQAPLHYVSWNMGGWTSLTICSVE